MVSAGRAVGFRQEHQYFAGLGILESDTAQIVRGVLLSVETIQREGLIADDAGGAIGGSGIHPMRIQI